MHQALGFWVRGAESGVEGNEREGLQRFQTMAGVSQALSLPWVEKVSHPHAAIVCLRTQRLHIV